jgi:hypothetical protein
MHPLPRKAQGQLYLTFTVHATLHWLAVPLFWWRHHLGGGGGEEFELKPVLLQKTTCFFFVIVTDNLCLTVHEVWKLISFEMCQTETELFTSIQCLGSECMETYCHRPYTL